LQRLLVGLAGDAAGRNPERAGGLAAARVDHVLCEDGVERGAADGGGEPEHGDRNGGRAELPSASISRHSPLLP
jgi:hypothetical protein